jgi:hypothetical protein
MRNSKNMAALVIVVLMVMGLAGQAFLADAATPITSGFEKDTAVTLSLVNQDPDPAAAGDTVDVRIGVANLGGIAAANQVVEIVPSYPFELLPGDSAVQKIGSIGAYQGIYDENSQIIKFRLMVNKDATEGNYSLQVLNYEEGSSVKSQTNLAIDVKGKASADVIHIDKSVIVPGNETSLKFTINNVGTAPLSDLTFSWDNSDNILLPVESDNTKYIRYIDVGKSADVEYNVIADTNAAPGLYKLNLHLTYYDSATDSEKTITSIAGVYVGGGTDFDVAFSESTGTENTFSVANVGSNEAYSVSVIIPEQSGWSVTGSNSAIIGNLDKGDYTVATFSLQSTANSAAFQTGTAGTRVRNTNSSGTGATGALPARLANSGSSESLLVRITYTNTMGERVSVDKAVPMNTKTISGNNSTSAGAAGAYGNFAGRRRTSTPVLTYALYIIGALALIFGFFGYRRYQSEKLVNPKYKLTDVFKDLFKKKSKK